MAVLVFGSNLAGRHGAGSALYARREYGAILGQGVGRQGNSYGIPTKDADLRVLSLEVINTYVQDFFQYALDHPEEEFEVCKIGCGLAGYDDSDMAPLFKDAPSNCILPHGWREWGAAE